MVLIPYPLAVSIPSAPSSRAGLYTHETHRVISVCTAQPWQGEGGVGVIEFIIAFKSPLVHNSFIQGIYIEYQVKAHLREACLLADRGRRSPFAGRIRGASYKHEVGQGYRLYTIG